MSNYILSCAETLNKLLTVMGRKFKLSDRGNDLAPFVADGNKLKIPSDIKPPLASNR